LGNFRKHIRSIHRNFDGVWGRFIGNSPYIKELTENSSCKLTPENFYEFTYSKTNHFNNFHLMPIYQRQTLNSCDLKVYQDLFVYSFILENIPKGAKILEVGGGESRIISCLKKDYEFWNLDKLEGQGEGPKALSEHEGFSLVKDYIGAFTKQLPDQHFDLIYSISAVEHFLTDSNVMDDIIQDFQRLQKKNAYCLHCVDALIYDDHIWMHPIINEIKSKVSGVIAETSYEKIRADQDLWALPNYAYYTRWFPITRKRIRKFGRPFSLNILWQNS
jgi:hypothetical protein